MSDGILFTADQHTGLATHDGPTLDGRPSWRQVEAESVADIVQHTASQREAYTICAGDFYNSRKPPAWAYAVEADYPGGFAILGNHDAFESRDKVPPLSVARELQPVRTPTVTLLGAYAVVFIPWFGRSLVAREGGMSVAEQFARMETALAAIVTQKVAEARALSEHVLVVAHLTVAGAEYNSGTQPMLGEASEFMVPAHVLAQPGVEAVYLGHVHKPQTFYSGDIPITYIGSAIRHDFGDEANVCRALYVEPGKPVEEIELPATRFVTVPVESQAVVSVPNTVDGAVVRFKGELPAGMESAARLARLREEALAMGALKVAKPAVRFVRHDVRREHEFRIDASPTDTLRRYFELAGGEYAERTEPLVALHGSLMEGGTE